MTKMTVITFAKTGHVLAAVSRTTLPDAPATVAQVAAGGIRMRNAQGDRINLTIRESELGTQLVEYQTEVLHRPQLFALEDGQPEQKTASAGPVATLNGTQIIVTLPLPGVTTSTSVWCQISGGALTEPIVRAVTIPGTASSAQIVGTEALILATGSYLVALFAPGYVVTVQSVNVP